MCWYMHTGAGRSFVDFMDAQWECEGELIQVSSETLNPRQLLLYQHGQFLLQHLHLHKMVWICLSFLTCFYVLIHSVGSNYKKI